MRRFLLVLLPLFCAGLLEAVAAEPAAGAEPAAPATAFIPVDTAALLGSPDAPPLLEAEVAFPHLRFESPVDITHAGDGSGRLFVASQEGRIHVFPDRRDVREAQVFLDIRPLVAREWFEEGLLALAFHPRYRENGELFVYYSLRPLATRLSRFRVSPADPDRAEAGSEERLLEIPQPFWNHNSGSIEFGPDGFLYVGVGDGGAADDPHGNGQNPRTLLGSILRLDIARRDPGKAYVVPADNPFTALGERARPEIWALGLRNPWKLCFDRETGALWAADVGQDLWEEVNVITRGGNYGWRVREGTHPFDREAERFGDDLIDPVWEYHHSDGRSITGGVVYRGARFPELRGVYLCADFLSGNIWGLRWDGTRVVESRKVAPPLTGISAFGEDEAGEVYFTAFDGIPPVRVHGPAGGRVYTFRRAAPEPASGAQPFPRTLAATGLFSSVKDHVPAPGLIPYDVNVPLWSDGAGKDRFLALPAAGKVVFSDEGSWELPVGTVLVKTFSLEMVEGDPASRRRLETRLLVHGRRGWAGYTYVWNDGETEASLIDGYVEKTYRVRTAHGEVDRGWYFPGRTDCLSCHTAVRGRVLGLNTRQLNREPRSGERSSGGRRENQLRRLERLGVFTEALPRDPYALEAYPDWDDWDDDRAPVEALARAYLDANCAHCHAPGGTGMAPIDLRFHSPLAATRLLARDRAPAAEGEPPPPVVPQDPAASQLIARLLTRPAPHVPGDPRPPNPMPPLAARLRDERAIEVLRRWISSLGAE